MITNIILLAVFGAVLVALWREGLWASIVMLFNLLLAATVATRLLPVVVPVVEPRLTSYTYFVDALVLWGLFAVLVAVARGVTDHVSKTRVRFHKPVERFGTPLAAALAAWVAMAFTAAALHTAPLPRNVVPGSGMFFGLAPDRGWLWWTVGTVGKDPFGRQGDFFGPPVEKPDVALPQEEEEEAVLAPPTPKQQIDRFIEHYARRRLELETLEGLRNPG
jgi:hypothetical protein